GVDERVVVVIRYFCCFFFSSRRRHTRSKRDWSSDVCSSDLTSVCITGLVTVTTATHWSSLGHIVILLLIQLGGLGTITLMSLAFFATGKRISLQNRLLMADAFN